MTTVLVVDDQELVRTGFSLILQRGGIDVVGEAADGREAVARAVELGPDVVVMDIRMPTMDGIEATRALLTRRPQTKVLALTTFDADELVYEAVRAGVAGFQLKDVSPADLVHAVEVVARGDTLLAPALTRRLLQRFAAAPAPGPLAPPVAGLPEREREILTLVARGLSNGESGRQLFLSEATVKTYVSRLLRRLELRDRLQLAVLAYEAGLVRAGAPGPP
jgi:DNA-binding NarL/FixJ family response regulator